MVALLTDFGIKDTYVAEIKAAIYSRCEDVQIIDITHEIEPQNIKQAAFLLSTTYSHFPEGTIIVAVVDPGVGSEREMIATTDGKVYFVGPDNGIFCFLNDLPNTKVYKLDNSLYWANDVSSTFHGRDIFAPVAAHIASGVRLDKFGKMKKLVTECKGLKPEQINGQIIGKILWIDRFGNAISNVHKDLLIADGKTIYIELENIDKMQISVPMFDNFTEAQKQKGDNLFCYIGSKNYLEFAVPNDSACKKYNIRIGCKVIVESKK